MGFNEGVISKSKVVTFLLGLLGSFSQDRDRVSKLQHGGNLGSRVSGNLEIDP